MFRISQPDLKTMIQDTLLSNNWAKIKNKYSATKGRDLPTGTHYLNFIWNAWGHKFNHSYESLKYELERAGFRKVAKCLYHQSEYPELCSVENRSKEVDSLILEGVK